MNKLKTVAISVAIAFCMANANAAPITVVTSFPKELTDIYKLAFEQRHPDIPLEFVSRSTESAINLIQDTAPGQRPEVFWASAPEAFERLAHDKLLEKAPEVRNPYAPPYIGKYPMNDADNYYYGQALSGYGIMWNKRYLQDRRLPPPAEWSDLAKSTYFGHVAMSTPSRSGTTHLTVETILQGEGWINGWSQLLQIAGNCTAITDRSFDVPDGVRKGQYGIGLVIDFFGLSAKYSGFPVQFVYPSVTAVVPASIGLIAGARNSADAKTFIAFTLSRPGQEVLLDPRISRIPILPYGDFFDSVPGTYPNIFGVARRAKVRFDSHLAQARRTAVTLVFDQTITHVLPELQRATKAIHEAETQVSKARNPRAMALLKRARALVFTPLITEETIPAFMAMSKPKSDAPSDTTATKLMSPQQLQNQARENYKRALELATEAAALKS